MRIYTRAGDLAFKLFTFPDGQPHFQLETYEREFQSVCVETAIRNPMELLQALLVNQVLRQHGYSEVNLDIRYLLGARMDRAIRSDQPFTLELVARLINGAGFTRVRILDVHSDVATRLIRNSWNLLPLGPVRQVLMALNYPLVVSPDKGAYDRVAKITHEVGSWNPFLQCGKVRDTATGALSGFKVYDPSLARGRECLIVDDICDGGGTFVGLAKELRAAGASKVHLYVTHGIFSKGLPLEGIDHVYTTDSFSTYEESSERIYPGLTVIPVSMKEI
jgi:ribose-phosphate pyrophosphokinase